MSSRIDELEFDSRGLIPAIIQDVKTRQVLMLAYMNRQALEKTLETGYTWFYSRSRECLWMKGETSGHIQKVQQIYYDCDQDTLLILIEQEGAACHTGHFSCFYRNWEGEEQESRVFDPEEVYSGRVGSPAILYELYDVLEKRKELRPQGSYTAYLFNEGQDKILKKVGEETAEVIISSKNHNDDEIIYETSDLLYHLMVLLVYHGINLSDIFGELKSRR
ncbi:MAG: bifunctional phosphoribosyl-AMP cyclohydrolase/phosphoribosyl-ATP diphosphatase HisIE [Syntrophomonadaceae bacterium]|jgi:phosphoribosyl-ATP pyrophosphohydrolase/phosphoribosyl-AMP cyclohydrolase|nr:bifunctional phosphoribosyl-AMP cyclohydrolase/phosphoribosyl-ATP diphosphatase HisIE [Syntrophomonadaceae bacterium]